MSQPTFSAKLVLRGQDDVKAAFERMKKDGEKSFQSLRRTGEGIGKGIDTSVKVATRTTTASARVMRVALNGVNTTVNVLGRGVRFVSDQIRTLTRVAGVGGTGLAGAFVAANVGLRAYTRRVSEGVEANRQLASSTGVSIEALTAWQAATRVAGGNADVVGSSFSSLRDRIVDVAQELDPRRAAELAAPFTQLGISVRDASGQLKSAEDVMFEVSDALSKIESDSLRARAAQDLFGSAASGLLPVLEDGSDRLRELLQEGGRAGTQLSQEQAEATRELLERQRRVSEALRGVGLTLAGAFLPIFTDSTERLGKFLDDNREAITRTIQQIAREFATFSRSMAAALGGGPISEVENSFVRRLTPAIRGTRDVFLDLLDVIRGRGLGSRVPWIRPLIDGLIAAGATALAFGDSILRAIGISRSDLPTVTQAFEAIKTALDSVRAGIEGNAEAAPFPWLGTVGTGIAELGRGIANFGLILSDNKEAIAGFGSAVATAFADALGAIRDIIAGNEIDADNIFGFLNVVVPVVSGALSTLLTDLGEFFGVTEDGAVTWRDVFISVFETLTTAIRVLYEGFKANIQNLIDAFNTLVFVLDIVAGALGLGDAKSLALILILGRITGLLPALFQFSFVVSTISNFILGWSAAIGRLLVVLFKLGGWLAKTKIFAAFIGAAKVAFGGLAAVVLTPFGLVIAGILAAGALIFIFWDEIVEAAKFAWEVVKAIWGGVTKFFGALFEGIGKVAKGAWNGLSAGASAAWDIAKSAWDAAPGFFSGLWNSISENASAAWDLVKSGAGSAYDFAMDAWSGFTSYFKGVTERVSGFFKDLWSGVRDGAASAWSSVKSFFGGGGSSSGGRQLESFDVGGQVPGRPGEPRLATVHGGEWIFNPKQAASLNAVLASLADLVTSGMQMPMPEPAMAAAPGRQPHPLSLGIGMQQFGGFYADGPDAVQQVRRSLQRKSTTNPGGGTPRWKGGYK